MAYVFFNGFVKYIVFKFGLQRWAYVSNRWAKKTPSSFLLTVDTMHRNHQVFVSGHTKGRGYHGVMKRWDAEWVQKKGWDRFLQRLYRFQGRGISNKIHDI